MSMKDNNEFKKLVYDKRDAYLIRKRQICQKVIAATITVSVCFVIVVFVIRIKSPEYPVNDNNTDTSNLMLCDTRQDMPTASLSTYDKYLIG